MSKWLAVVGMGEDGLEGVSPRARRLIAEAEAIVGSERLLAKVPAGAAERHLWPQPFSAVVGRIRPLRGRRTVVLATGDPSNYGVARKLHEIVPFEEIEIVPHLSSFSLAAARLGWSLPDCDAFSLHGRPVCAIEAFIQPGARLMALTENGATVRAAARRLVSRGYGRSTMTVLENMGGPHERSTSFTAQVCPDTRFSDLNTLAIHCVADPGAALLPRSPGLPDEAFVHDGQITKRETRAVTLAALGPAPDALLWDIGAGCGSISIEWMRCSRGAMAIAFEQDASRLRMIAENMDRLGTPRLVPVEGRAPASLAGQPAPDAIFIGGGVGDEGVFEIAWAALRPGGRMVANVVTLEGELHLVDLQEKHGGELVRLEVSTLHRIGPLRALKPRMPVVQWRAAKPW